MKSKLPAIRLLATGLVFLCMAFIFFAKNANAITVAVDQRCRVTADLMGSMSVTNRTDLLQQSFRPTLDRLTKVSLYMEGDGVGSITLWVVQDSESGTYYINSNSPVAEPNGKGMVEFLFDNVVMIPGEDYFILPNPTDNSKLNWFYQSNCYADGIGYMGQVAKTFDFGFQTYGYMANQVPQQNNNFFLPTFTPTVTPTATTTPTPTPTKTTTPTPTPTVAVTLAPTGMGSGEMGVIIAIPTASPTPTDSINPEIPLPKVEYVLKNVEKIENLNETVELSKTDGFVLYGSAEKDSDLLITVGKNSYKVTTDGNGNWYLQLPLSEIDPGTYTVTAQTQADAGEGKVTEIATVNVLGDKVTGLTNEPITNKPNYYLYAAAVLVILIGLTLLGMYFEGRKKSAKSIEEKPIIAKEEPIVENPSATPEIK